MNSKSFRWGRGVFFALLVLSVSVVAPARAAEVTVNCDNGERLQAAIDGLSPTGAHIITVTGTCRENVFIGDKDNVTVWAPDGQTATLVSADEAAGVVLYAYHVGRLLLRRLVIDGAGQYVDGIDVERAEAIIQGCTIQNGAAGVAAFNGSNVTLGGSQAGRAVVISNHTDIGVYEGESVVTLNGQVTIENINGGVGLWAAGGRVSVSGGRVGNTIRDVGTNGFGAYAVRGAVMTFNGVNTLQNNGDVGIGAGSNSTVMLNSNVLQDGTRYFTTIEGHATAGVMVADSFLACYGPEIRNNGSAPATTDAGVAASRHATILVRGSAVTNNVGPGVYADANSVVDFIDSSITGNTGDGVRVAHLSTARFGGMYTDGTPAPANTVISGNGGAPVSCDDTSVVYGDLTGLSPFACKVTTEKKPPKAVAAAASLDAIERRAEERLNRWLERRRPRE